MSIRALLKALGARRVGRGWMAPCPAHDDRVPSLSIRIADAAVLVRCHAGCEQRTVIAALRARGLWNGSDQDVRSFSGRDQRSGGISTQDEDLKRTRVAMRIWQQATLALGSPVETYLRSRGIFVATPFTIRFHNALRHPSGGTWPAIVALVTSGREDMPRAVHRTYLLPDGSGKASAHPQKMMLGPCRGSAVRLATHADTLMVGEGIETCLAVMQATGYPAWAALSTAGLRTLELPPNIHDVVVLADGDEPGEAAARDAALRWKREGRRVRIARPPRGFDFNDVLMGRAFEDAA